MVGGDLGCFGHGVRQHRREVGGDLSYLDRLKDVRTCGVQNGRTKVLFNARAREPLMRLLWPISPFPEDCSDLLPVARSVPTAVGRRLRGTWKQRQSCGVAEPRQIHKAAPLPHLSLEWHEVGIVRPAVANLAAGQRAVRSSTKLTEEGRTPEVERAWWATSRRP
eukprot:4349212-Prymnesium_polylepis.2